MLALAGLESWAQNEPAAPAAAAPAPGLPAFPQPNAQAGSTAPAQSASPVINRSRQPRYGVNNGAIDPNTTQPRYVAPQNGDPNGASVLPGNGNNSGSNGGGAKSDLDELVPKVHFEGVDLNQVLQIYAQYVGRTLLRAALPDAKITLDTSATPLTKGEMIQALQAVLALNNVSVINVGEKFVKVLPSDQANTAAGEIDRSGSMNLPSLGSYITHVVQLRYVKPSEMIQIIQPFAKLPNSILAIDSNGILVLRDYAENVKRMLEMIEQIDISVPAEYISEVIPIRYAKVDEIASALTSLGGGGGTVAGVGTAPSSGQISGFGSRSGGISGVGGGGGIGGNNYQNGGINSGAFGARSTGTTLGGANPNGSPNGQSTFAQRLNNIINKAGGGSSGGQQDPIQLFGQTKIVPNESSSTLLIYATRQDMVMIKEIIAKLDVPLAQVLVEAVIMDVTIGHTFNLGVSAAQNPQANGNFVGGGGINNGQSFLGVIQNLTTNYNGTNITSVVNSFSSSLGTNGGSSFGNSLPGGLSYFGNIGQTWDLAITAAESDSHASIIQRPRIQTSQAKPAQFFVGNTVPYVTGNTYGGAYGNSSSYSQLSVGVELDVTPFINPDGEVAMDIQQEIDDLDGYTAISGVGNVPNTIKRTLNTSITVRDRDTVMLGGFIKSDKSTSKSGVPFLSSIPILGNLFTQRSDSKDRQELIVLMRPTVLKTPKLAAENTIKESQRLPGVSRAISEDVQYQEDLVAAERKRELKAAKNGSNTNGFFNMVIPVDAPTNAAPATLETPSVTNAPALIKPQTPAASAPQKASARAVKTTVDAATAQQKKLDAVMTDYMTGKITADEANAERTKILAGGN